MSPNFDTPEQQLDDCGCCRGMSEATPVAIRNRAGLSAIAYRIGTHALFKQSMQAWLSASKYPALAGLTTREDDDFSIALLDAWATVSDVLTFYQERIANESYLRTATERFSIRQLARLIGYELSPGVAAGAYLAFVVEEPMKLPETTAPDRRLSAPPMQGYQPPDRVTVEIGTKVQSIPGQDELPQTFETVEKIEARAEWNAIRPRLTEPQILSAGTETVYLKGTATNLNKGDKVLIVPGSGSAQKPGYGVVKEVQSETDLGRTKVSLIPESKSTSPGTPNPRASRNFALADAAGPERTAMSESSVENLVLNGVWKEEDLRAFMELNNWSCQDLARVAQKLFEKKSTESAGEVHVFREQASFFGHNAPYYQSLKDRNSNPLYAGFGNWDQDGWEIWKNPLGKGAYYDDTGDDDTGDTADVYLDRTIQGVMPESWALFVPSAGKSRIYRIARTNEKSLVGFGMSGKGTGLVLEKNDGRELMKEDKCDKFKVRKTTAYVKSELLKLTEMPFRTEWLHEGDSEITLEGLVCGLSIGQAVMLTGELKEAPKINSSEILFIDKITHDRGFTKLRFREGLSASYAYETVTLNANVALATHGETVVEVLGSGDGSKINQQFLLRQPPLTYVSSPEPGGAESTLKVRVNDLLWEEVPDFYGRGSEERIFITRANEDGSTTVLFGDGRTGARLPTGTENVRAQYRKGIGVEGNVRAGRLAQLMTRPLGLKQAFNPLDASGGDDSETLDSARTNAPLKVLTLDRIVSLKDYEDFARAFAGISKTLATWTWDGTRRAVVVTVSGPEGADIKPEEATYKNLLEAMRNAGDPHVSLQVKCYCKAFFRIAGTVWVSRDCQPEKVQVAVEEALRAQFGFDARGFGQPVRLSEVVAVIQAVPNVVAVDIDQFYRADRSPEWNPWLPAAIPEVTFGGEVTAAELLVLDATALNALVVTKDREASANNQAKPFFHSSRNLQLKGRFRYELR